MDPIDYTHPDYAGHLLGAFAWLPLEEVRELPRVCSAWATWIRLDNTGRQFSDRRVHSFKRLSFCGALRLASFVTFVDNGYGPYVVLRDHWERAATWLGEAIHQPDTLADLHRRLEDGAAFSHAPGGLIAWLEHRHETEPALRSAFFSGHYMGAPEVTAHAELPQVLERNTRAEARIIAVAAFRHSWAMLDQILEKVPVDVLHSRAYPALCDAEVFPDPAAITGLLDRGADVDLSMENQYTCLQRTTQGGHEASVQLLLERGADPNICGYGGRAALHEAAWKGNIALVRILLEAGSSLDTQCSSRWSPLHYAYKFPEVCKLLLERGADPNRVDSKGMSCLARAAKDGCEDTVNALLEHPHTHPLDLELPDASGYTALWHAVEGKHLNIATALVKVGASTKVVSRYGIHLVHYADSVDMLTLLLDHGAPLEGCLSRAAGGGDLERVNLLLDRGAQVNGKGEDIPILESANHFEVVERLLKAGADLTIVNGDGWGFLHFAALYKTQDFRTVDLALEKGLDINMPDGQGHAPLSLAISGNESLKSLEGWLTRGAKIDHQDNEGCSVLHWAIIDSRGYERSLRDVRFFLAKGASVDLVDSKGRSAMTKALALSKCLYRASALIDRAQACVKDIPDWVDTFEYEDKFTNPKDLAVKLLKESTTLGRFKPDKFAVAKVQAECEIRAHRLKIVQLLLSHGASADTADRKGFYPLHRAAMEGDSPLVQLLLDSGGQTGCLDAQERSPLHWAALRGHHHVATLLLERGATPELEDRQGNTPLMLAKSSHHRPTIKALSGKQ